MYSARLFSMLMLGLAMAKLSCEAGRPDLKNLPEIDFTGSEKQVIEKIKMLKEEVEKSPHAASSWGKLAMNLDVHDFKHEAIPYYEQAFALDSTDFRWPYFYAMLLDHLGVPDATGWFEYSRLLNPDYLPLKIRLANVAMKSGQLDEAERLLEEAVEIDSNFAWANIGLAQIALHGGYLERSRELLLRTLANDSLNREAFGLLAEVARRLGRKAESEMAIRNLQHLPSGQTMPDSIYGLLIQEGVSALWYRTRGEKLLAGGRAREAAEQFEQGLQYNPSAAGFVFVGELYEQSGQDSLAIQNYQTALRANGSFVPAYLKLAKIFYKQGEYQTAIQWTEKGLRINGRIPEFYDNLANCYVATNRIESAINTYRYGLGQTRGNIYLYTRLAWLLATGPDASLRNGAEALKLARYACERTQYETPLPLDALAAAYAASGDFERAVEFAQKALQLALSSENDLANEIRSRLECYRAGKPFRM
jgi:tetratricopeptide (TPR) repeat protein